ncbi:hypothetical protein ABIE13_001894 [Ottowia thiooxydans]|uniref:Uncharacterized protein n=1 Tax=Ottowia thiooxydans TaxID=219182 RepID=A0ABV2Q6Y6_9BURK
MSGQETLLFWGKSTNFSEFVDKLLGWPRKDTKVLVFDRISSTHSFGKFTLHLLNLNTHGLKIDFKNALN